MSNTVFNSGSSFGASASHTRSQVWRSLHLAMELRLTWHPGDQLSFKLAWIGSSSLFWTAFGYCSLGSSTLHPPPPHPTPTRPHPPPPPKKKKKKIREDQVKRRDWRAIARENSDEDGHHPEPIVLAVARGGGSAYSSCCLDCGTVSSFSLLARSRRPRSIWKEKEETVPQSSVGHNTNTRSLMDHHRWLVISYPYPWISKGPFTHAIFDAISDAISRTKRAWPYPARMFISRSILWIGKKGITYYLKTPFFRISANLAVFCRGVTRL